MMRSIAALALLVVLAPAAWAVEPGCPGSASPDPDVLFCEDWESPAPILDRFVEYNDQGGKFVRVAGEGVDGSHAMRVTWNAGQVSGGWLLRSFGRTPPGFYAPQSHGSRDFREIFWREYVRTGPGWDGHPSKLSRVYGIADDNWAQSVIAHLWNSGNDDFLLTEPASGIDVYDQLVTTTYNDFANLRWLGGANAIDGGWSGTMKGVTPVYSSANADTWFCVEAHVRLNTPGQSDGVLEFFVDGQLEARLQGLNLVGSWQDYGINAISLENYWNGGAPGTRERFRDNLVVATAPIGCIGDTPWPDCSDGVDNDHDGQIDWDGAGVGPPDANCHGNPEGTLEAPVCGLGAELVLLAPVLRRLRRRRRDSSGIRHTARRTRPGSSA